MGMYIADPNLDDVTINLDSVGDQLTRRFTAATNAKFDECIAANLCTADDHAAALASIPSQVEDAKQKLQTQIITELSVKGITGIRVGNNVRVNGADALRAAGAGASVEGMKADIYAERDKAIADFNKEVKDYGYFPMVKIGLMYRF